MKNVGRYIAIVTIAAAAGPAFAAAPCQAPAPAPDAELASQANLTYPEFCAIPAKPKDVRPVEAFRTAVVRTRVAGAIIVRQSAPETFSLTGTEGFAQSAKGQAAPPPAMTLPGEANTEAFVAKSKARATPPKRPRRR